MKPTILAMAIALASSGVNAETIDTIIVQATADDSAQATTTSDPRVSKAQGATTVTADDMKKSQATTVEQALEGIPSVQVNEKNGGQGSEITIRGLSSANVSVRVDGAPDDMANIAHYDTNDRDTYWINMDMYSSVSVIPGAAANVYGTGSTGGVVLLNTKSPEDIIEEGRDWGADLRYTHGTNGVSNKLTADLAKKFGDKFAVNTTVSGLKSGSYEDGNGNEPEDGYTGTKNLDYLVKGVYTPDDAQRLEISALNHHQNYSNYSTSETKIKAQDKTASAKYIYNPKDNDLVDMLLRLSHRDVERNSLASGSTDWARTGEVATDYFELENTSKLKQSESVTHSVRYGVDYTHDDVAMMYTNDDGSNVQSDRKQLGLYSEDTMFIGRDLQVTGSLRFDNYSTTRDGSDLDGKNAFSPKVSTKWMPFENTAAHGLGFTALLGAGYRAPTVWEVYGKGDSEYSGTGTDGCNWYSCVLANPDLKGESSVDSEIGATFDRKNLFTTEDRFSMKVNYFYNDIDDRITNETTGTVTSGGQTYNITQYVNVDKAKVYGWEVNMDYDNPFLFANFSLQQTTGYGYEDGVRSKLEDVVPRTVTAKVGTYYSEHQGRVGVSSKWQEGREVDDAVYSSFHTYNLFTSYQVNKHLSLQASIENLTNEVYSKDEQSTSDGVDTTVYEAGRNYKFTADYKF